MKKLFALAAILVALFFAVIMPVSANVDVVNKTKLYDGRFNMVGEYITDVNDHCSYIDPITGGEKVAFPYSECTGSDPMPVEEEEETEGTSVENDKPVIPDDKDPVVPEDNDDGDDPVVDPDEDNDDQDDPVDDGDGEEAEKPGNPGNDKPVGNAGETPNDKGGWGEPPAGDGTHGMSDPGKHFEKNKKDK